MKTRALLLLVAAGFAGPAMADQDRIAKASVQTAILLYGLSELMIVAEMCSVGKREEWQRVVGAIDRRYRFCVGRDQSWAGLLGEFKEAEATSVREGSSRSLGSFATDALLSRGVAAARAKGAEAYCSGVPSQEVMDKGVPMIAYIRKLGTDAAWIEAPCDKDFWPPYSADDK